MEISGVENLQTAGGLVACPDCQHRCSTFAESCPSCGRYFRVYARNFTVQPGSGWSITIFWGIMLVWIIPALIGALLVVIFFVIGGLGAATLSRPDRPSTTLRP